MSEFNVIETESYAALSNELVIKVSINPSLLLKVTKLKSKCPKG